MANIEIKTCDPRFAMGIAEGVNAVELRVVKAEYAKLQAKDGVRREGDDRRWERTRRRLARKYSTKPVGRARGAILGGWALFWTVIYNVYEHFSEINREV